jgi:hypothetical protein
MKTAQIICDIIQHELDLEPGQVMVYNQRFPIPTSVGVFITVGMIGIKPYSNTSRQVGDLLGMNEEQSVAMAELLSVNVMSANTSTLDLYPFVLMAFASNYSQQQQDNYQIRIAVIPTAATDTSFLEETSQMTRQTVTLQVLRSYSKIKAISYYDDFTDEILTEQGAV